MRSGAILLTLAFACASGPMAPMWEKDGASPEALESTRSECASEATAALDSYSTGAGGRSFEFCMESKGWRKVSPQ